MDDLRSALKLTAPIGSDAALAELVVSLRGGDLRYISDRGEWRGWDDRRWTADVDDIVVDAFKETSIFLFKFSTTLEGGDASTIRTWAIKASNKSAVTGALFFMRADERIRIRQCDLDQHPHMLVVQNGTVNLQTGELLPHRREDLLTRYTPIVFDPAAACPRWEQFLREILVKRDNDTLVPDEELITWIARAVGYGLTGDIREHCFFLLHGDGRNGKGVFTRTIAKLAGDAADSTGFETFTASKKDGNKNSPETARLAGARLVVAGEAEQGVRFNESMIKLLTGGDKISACGKYTNPFTYFPIYKIFLHANYLPRIRGTDDGIWSRVRLIPFLRQYLKKEGYTPPDEQLEDKLTAEYPGILAWAIRGAVEWYRDGLGMPSTVAAASQTYREESDVITAFLEDEFIISSSNNDRIPAKTMQQTYLQWCADSGYDHPMGPEELKVRLGRRGITQGRSNGRRYYFGARPKSAANTAAANTAAANTAAANTAAANTAAANTAAPGAAAESNRDNVIAMVASAKVPPLPASAKGGGQ